jgi:prepilin-type N-terminal cleavage/methylation domain-containing protein
VKNGFELSRTEKVGRLLKSSSDLGFTLIELLVGMAILAVLVGLVIVMIDPVERLRASRDRQAAANVRSVGSAINTCVTGEFRFAASGRPYGPASVGFTDPHVIPDSGVVAENGCGNFTWMADAARAYSSSTRPNPPTITIWNNGTSNPSRICVWAQVTDTNDYWIYSTSRPQARTVTLGSAPSDCSATFDTL